MDNQTSSAAEVPLAGETSKSSMFTLLSHVKRRNLSDVTRRDYLRQINRCQTIYRVNSLQDVSADIAAFLEEWPPHRYDPDRFASRSIYRAWRGKMLAVLREFHGHAAASAERRQRRDGWSVLMDAVVAALRDKETARKRLIPISVFADEARRRDIAPAQISQVHLAEMIHASTPARRTSIRLAVRTLTRLALDAPDIADMLPPGGFGDCGTALRLDRHRLPSGLETKIDDWVHIHCGGSEDFITGEREGVLSNGAAGVYRAALRKYIFTALKNGAIKAEIGDLLEAFTLETIRGVLRTWTAETDRTERISVRTITQYCQSLTVLLKSVGGNPDLFSEAMRSRILKQGKAASASMSPDVQAFCMRLVRDRHLEMTFRSLHRQFQRLSLEAMERGDDARGIQLGVLAAFSAIELWAVPLRVSNALELRMFGPEPSLYLPRSDRESLKIQVPAAEVKNGKGVRAELRPGRDRALEVIGWYVAKIRPQIPWSNRSRGLFPGWKSEFLTAGGLRNWLAEHSGALGLPMTPHNFRHGGASLYLSYHPGDYAAAAQLLGDTEETVRHFYAWIDQQTEMQRVQTHIAKSAGIA